MLDGVLGPLIDDLGDAPDSTYVRNPGGQPLYRPRPPRSRRWFSPTATDAGLVHEALLQARQAATEDEPISMIERWEPCGENSLS